MAGCAAFLQQSWGTLIVICAPVTLGHTLFPKPRRKQSHCLTVLFILLSISFCGFGFSFFILMFFCCFFFFPLRYCREGGRGSLRSSEQLKDKMIKAMRAVGTERMTALGWPGELCGAGQMEGYPPPPCMQGWKELLCRTRDLIPPRWTYSRKKAITKGFCNGN